MASSAEKVFRNFWSRKGNLRRELGKVGPNGFGFPGGTRGEASAGNGVGAGSGMGSVQNEEGADRRWVADGGVAAGGGHDCRGRDFTSLMPAPHHR